MHLNTIKSIRLWCVDFLTTTGILNKLYCSFEIYVIIENIQFMLSRTKHSFSALFSHTYTTHCLLLDTYMRCVQSGVQSGRYLAPMSRAFSLSSPLNGFWKPLRTNTTPSMIRFNGTCCMLWDLAFWCLGLGSGLDWLSRFLSTDFCAGEAEETIDKVKEVFHVKKKNWNAKLPTKCYLLQCWDLLCWACVSEWQLCSQVRRLGLISWRVGGQRQTVALC